MVIELINECGDKEQDVILKTDQEAAIKFLVDDVCVNRTGTRTIKECAPQGSKGSNGIAVWAVQSVEQCPRTLKSSLDERMGVKMTCCTRCSRGYASLWVAWRERPMARPLTSV